MQSINHIYIYLIIAILLGAACDRKTNSHVSSVDVSQNKSDTFPNALQGAEKTDPGDGQADDYIRPLLDSIKISRYISDMRNADSIYSNLIKFYELKNNQLAWYTAERPLPQTDELLKSLLKAGRHGLDSTDYDVFKLANLQNAVYGKGERHPLALAILDVRTSVSAITFAWHLKNGRRIPAKDEGLWLKNWKESSVATILAESDFPGVIESLVPTELYYEPTLKAVKKYETIASKGGWPILPEDILLQEGDSSQAVKVLKKRLSLSGDFKGDTSALQFNKPLRQAVERFQLRHGLKQDGVVGNATLDALRVPAETRLRKLQTNLERLRWMPEELGEKYITINIPEYKLSVFENQQEIMSMAVIVGTIENETPVFHDELEYIVFSPTWTVPKSIVTEEMLPEIRKDPNYLKERNYRVYDSWSEDAAELDPEEVDWEEMTADSIMIVQNPGTTNSLGRVKFMMPNSVSIYLHDTPAGHLFDKDQRTFSHGCIRIERPVEFADYLLSDNEEWDIRRIRESLNLEEPETVSLKAHIPVYITYRTAWADSGGMVHFREDIYGLDLREGPTFASL